MAEKPGQKAWQETEHKSAVMQPLLLALYDCRAMTEDVHTQPDNKQTTNYVKRRLQGIDLQNIAQTEVQNEYYGNIYQHMSYSYLDTCPR
jgi:hypothetical protein